MKKILIAALVFVTGTACTVFAQTYKTDYATQVTLAGSGTSLGSTITLKAATPAGSSFTYTLPDVSGTSGFVLSANNTSGGLSWVDPSVAANAWNLGGNTAPSSTILGNKSAAGVLDIRWNNATTLYLTGTNRVGVGGVTAPSGQFANTAVNSVRQSQGTNVQSLNWQVANG